MFSFSFEAGTIANLVEGETAGEWTDFKEATREERVYRRDEWIGQPLEVIGPSLRQTST